MYGTTDDLIGYYFQYKGIYVGWDDNSGMDMFIHHKIKAGNFSTIFNIVPDDFEFPTGDDLKQIYKNCKTVKGFREFIGYQNKYWTSDVYSDNIMYAFNFNRGQFSREYKSSDGCYGIYIRKIYRNDDLGNDAHMKSRGFYSHRLRWKKDLQEYDYN